MFQNGTRILVCLSLLLGGAPGRCICSASSQAAEEGKSSNQNNKESNCGCSEAKKGPLGLEMKG